MAEADPFADFRAELLDAGLLFDAGVDGLYGRSLGYESITNAVVELASRIGAVDGGMNLHFPPVMPRALLERTDYLRSFPDLTGSVHTFKGDDRLHAELLADLEAGRDWTRVLVPAEVVLRPTACHPLYPLCTGTLPAGGRRFEVLAWCFRHEPSLDPTRMQSFRMPEFVYVGEPDQAQRHRDTWVARWSEASVDLGLEVDVVVAKDPFFGRVGRVLATGQRDEALKLEHVTPIYSADAPTAIASANCHRDHFGVTFGITTAGGEVAHSACFGVGVDRVALALLHRHGLDPDGWPKAVRSHLWP
jgi:seryl-tRNA synthetase